MFGPVRIERTLTVPTWDGKRSRSALEYWRARGFQDVCLDSDGAIRGTRGSWQMAWASGFREEKDSAWGHVSPSKLPGTLEMAPEAEEAVRVQLTLHSWMVRRSGEWDAAFLRVEIVELQHLLLGKEMAAEVWSRFNRAARHLSRVQVRTKLLFGHSIPVRGLGRRLPEELEAEISDLEVRFLVTP